MRRPPRRAPDVPRETAGQSTVEFALLAPLLLVLFMGIAEAATAYDQQHTIVSLSREGANIASRGALLSDVIDVVMANGDNIALAELGGVVASRVYVEDGTPLVVEQQASPGYLGRSRIGALGEQAGPLQGMGLVNGQSLYVVEVFSPYRSFTPLSSFVAGAVPQGLYSRSVF